ncbi:hypothetical protein EDB80DRAFT_675842 [Ilyonectria destructans]|nr:hypothetical protein EDB80DRAFT_675842 [Ilyonectria destructans]
MALLVFQAMLFASCSKNKGNRSYRTEKTETSPLSLAPSALLMGWMPLFETTLSPHKTWLGLAIIQHAESINTDLHAGILAQFPPYDDNFKNQSNKGHRPHESIILQTNLMYMYYHTANVALCHHRISSQSIASNQAGRDMEVIHQVAQLHEITHELQGSTFDLIKCFKELTRRRLTHWLPMTAIARDYCETILSEQRVAIKPIDWIGLKFKVKPRSAECIGRAKYAADLTQIDTQVSSQFGHKSITDWSHILLKRPDLYLRIIRTIDLCISKGRPPQDIDFPAWLCVQLTAAKGAASRHSQQQQSLSSSKNSPAILGASLSHDVDHFVHLIPSVPESVSRDDSVGHEDGSAGLLLHCAHTTGSVSSYNQTSHNDTILQKTL